MRSEKEINERLRRLKKRNANETIGRTAKHTVYTKIKELEWVLVKEE